MEDFKNAVKTCFAKYANLNGRAARPEFWWFFLFQFLLYFVSGLVSNVLYFVAIVVLLLPGLAVAVRRLHDIGRSGWWLLIGFIPVIGTLVLIYWTVQPGDAGSNAYGEPPVGNGSATALAPGQQ